MKKNKTISRSICVILILIPCIIFAQENKKDAKAGSFQKMMDERNYVFKAETAMSMNGVNRQLTSEYELKISHDTISAYLPYFGRAYGVTDGPINFTSLDFEYKSEKGKKGSWEISIKPKDARDIQQLALSVFDSGNATLQVISTNRQAITFNGRVEARKRKSM